MEKLDFCPDCEGFEPCECTEIWFSDCIDFEHTQEVLYEQA